MDFTGGQSSYIPPQVRGLLAGPAPPAPVLSQAGFVAPIGLTGFENAAFLGGFQPGGRGGAYGDRPLSGRGGGFAGRGYGGGYGGSNNYVRGGGGYRGRGRNSFYDGGRLPNDDPFEKAETEKAEVDALYGAENTGINFDAYEDIPVETSGRNVPDHIRSFEDCNPPLPTGLLDNIRRCKYTKPTPVQRYALPIGIAGRDLMACAQTGSGKTAAFCFPIIASMLLAGYQPQPAAAAKFMLDSLDQFESFVGGASKQKEPPRVYQLPFPMQAVPMRPIMLDTASSYLEYPDISHRLPQSEKKGGVGNVLSSLTGWWGARK